VSSKDALLRCSKLADCVSDGFPAHFRPWRPRRERLVRVGETSQRPLQRRPAASRPRSYALAMRTSRFARRQGAPRSSGIV